MACDNCTSLFTGAFLCVNVPNGGTLQYGVQFQGIQSGPGSGQTSVYYKVCNCNTTSGTGISHINFELCTGSILPVQAFADGTMAEITGTGDAIFGVPNFKIENFGDVNAGECLTFQLIYNATFGEESLVPGLFGIKIGGGPTSFETTGSVEGLLVPCVVPTGCREYATAEVCAQATISLTPTVTPGTPVVSCVNGLVIGPCANISEFTPLPNTGVCTYTVSQVICVTIPLGFSVDVTATPSGGACGPVVPGTVCPALPPGAE